MFPFFIDILFNNSNNNIDNIIRNVNWYTQYWN